MSSCNRACFAECLLAALQSRGTPGAYAIHLLRSTPVVSILRFRVPTMLAQCLAGTLTFWVRTKPLAIATPVIGAEEFFAVTTFAGAVFWFHIPHRCVDRRRNVKDTRRDDGELPVQKHSPLLGEAAKRCSPRGEARAGPCRGRFTHFVPPPPTRAATGWGIGGPCRLPSRSADATIRPFRPPLRPPAPTAFPLCLAAPVPNHRLGATGGVPCASIIWLARAVKVVRPPVTLTPPPLPALAPP